jgi:hypothetical protein
MFSALSFKQRPTPTASRGADSFKGKTGAMLRRQKAKGKRQKAKVKTRDTPTVITFAFCPLPFAFCLL